MPHFCYRKRDTQVRKNIILFVDAMNIKSHLSRTKSRVSGSLTTDAVKPTALLPFPEV